MEYRIMTRRGKRIGTAYRTFFLFFFNKFAIKMFHPTIRKKGKFEIQNIVRENIIRLLPSYSDLFVFSHSKIAMPRSLDNLMIILVYGRRS